MLRHQRFEPSRDQGPSGRGELLPADQRDRGPRSHNVAARPRRRGRGRRGAPIVSARSVRTSACPIGDHCAGSVGPKSASVGAPAAAARWVTPESLPTNAPRARAARPGSAAAARAAGTASLRRSERLGSAIGPRPADDQERLARRELPRQARRSARPASSCEAIRCPGAGRGSLSGRRSSHGSRRGAPRTPKAREVRPRPRRRGRSRPGDARASPRHARRAGGAGAQAITRRSETGQVGGEVLVGTDRVGERVLAERVSQRGRRVGMASPQHRQVGALGSEAGSHLGRAAARRARLPPDPGRPGPRDSPRASASRPRGAAAARRPARPSGRRARVAAGRAGRPWTRRRYGSSTRADATLPSRSVARTTTMCGPRAREGRRA